MFCKFVIQKRINMQNLITSGKYNVSAIMKLAHSYLKAGSRNLSSALKNAWDKAQDAMTAFKVSLFTESIITADLSAWTKNS
jgi:hypothetical protein